MSRRCESAAQWIEAAAWMARSGDGRSCSGQSHCFSLWASASESFSSWGVPSKRILRMPWGTIPDVNAAITFIEKSAAQRGSTSRAGLLHKYNPLRYRYFPCMPRNRICKRAMKKPKVSAAEKGWSLMMDSAERKRGPL